jgi:NAD(P)-dependent dehydrogenase (short-subunit alcohol dehydrogenase family)
MNARSEKESNPSLAGVALVAGASRGLGLLIARELQRRGYQPIIAARSADELDRAAQRLAREGIIVGTVVMDVSDRASVDATVAKIERDIGPIELLMCVAGVIQVAPLAALERADFVEAVDVMLWGPVNTALAVVPAMRERGRGRIGVITSVGGLISAPHLLPYSTAKFGAVGFARGLRTELTGSGVSVTTVAPGLMRTGSHLHAWFRGQAPREYAWFAAAASAPVLSMDAERAARRIVAGVLRGRPVVVLTPLARLAPRVDALSPRIGSAVLSLTARLLPGWPTDGAHSPKVEGHRAEAMLSPRARENVRRLTSWGRKAATRTNE